MLFYCGIICILLSGGCSQQCRISRSRKVDASLFDYRYSARNLTVESAERGILRIQIVEKPLYRTRFETESICRNVCPDRVKGLIGFSGAVLCAWGAKELRTGSVVKGRDLIALSIPLPLFLYWACQRTHQVQGEETKSLVFESHPASNKPVRVQYGHSTVKKATGTDEDGTLLLDMTPFLSEETEDNGFSVKIFVPPPYPALIPVTVPPHVMAHLRECARPVFPAN
jgi:hypothetical protein